MSNDIKYTVRWEYCGDKERIETYDVDTAITVFKALHNLADVVDVMMFSDKAKGYVNRSAEDEL